MIIQLCGLSGAGKTTLTAMVKKRLQEYNVPAEVIDGDDYRSFLCRDLGFSKKDRCENMRRLGFVASKLSAHGIVAIISAINPYHEMRSELSRNYKSVHTVFVDCPIPALIKRDTKGLYAKALLPANHPDKISNLTGINDPFEIPPHPDLHLDTARNTKETCAEEFFSFIIRRLSAGSRTRYITPRAAVQAVIN